MHQIKIVIMGGPASGKTSVINFLAKRYKVYKEAAREVATKYSRFKGKTSVELRGLAFQKAIWQLQARHFKEAEKRKGKIIFFDRGIPDSFVYLKLSKINPPKELISLAKTLRYDFVFFLEPLPFYVKDRIRAETKKQAEKISRLLEEYYKKYKYHIIKIPFGTIEKRAKFILSHTKDNP
jgi:predicted ATPase